MRKYSVIILLIACVSIVGLSYGQAAIFKPSKVSEAERKIILKDLIETSAETFPGFKKLVKPIQSDSVSLIRVYSAIFDVEHYEFSNKVLPLLEPSLEQIWFTVATKNGDSVIAVCEKFDGKYSGLQTAYHYEAKQYVPVDKWLRKEKVSLSDKTLFYLGMQSNFHISSNMEVYVIDSCKKVKFSTFYKKKYGTIEAFRKSFIIGGE